MDSNTYSALSDRVGLVAVATQALAAEDLDQLSDGALVADTARLRQELDRLTGQWLRRLAAVDARGAAGADHDQPALSTAAWLRHHLRLGASTARSAVRTARALFGGALPATAQAVLEGAISPAHAQVVADGTLELPDHVKLNAEPVLLEAAGRLDPPRLRRLVGQLCQVADPDGADRARDRRHDRRGLWLSPTWEGMVAVDGLLEAEAGQLVLAALEPLARPHGADDPRKGGQRRADALTELARRALEGGRLPTAGGVRPQLLVTVELDSLLGRSGGLGGDAGWAGPLDQQACRRLACDGAITRAVVSRRPAAAPSRQPPGAPSGQGAGGRADHGHARDPSDPAQLQAHLRQAMTLLPAVIGGAPAQPLEVGRTTRVIHPSQRAALAVRDGGCVFPGCDRPLAWCDAHHLRHWVDGGPTDLANLALVCRAHHRAVHEEGWQLTRGPDGRFTATPSQRPRRPHRPHHPHPT